MREPQRFREWSSVVCWLAVWVLGGCHVSRGPGPIADANSNWLSYCNVNADCRAAGACICGLCTVTCQSDMPCMRSDRPASCVSPAAASGVEACAAVVQSSAQQICLPDCGSDADCGSGSRCTDGACWPRPAGLVDLRDAGTDAGMKAKPVVAPPRTLDASIDIGSLDAAESFNTPISLPEPDVQIQSTQDAPSLAGVWEQGSGETTGFAGPLRLEIRESPEQGLTGTLSFRCAGQCDPTGPIAPATDPTVGYPTGLTPADQSLLQVNVLPWFSYRIFDGRNTADSFRFWFSNNDLWRDWCLLQTPYPVPGQDRIRYACVSDAKPWVAIDTGPNATIGKSLLCSADASVCSCSATGCTFNPQIAAHDIDLIRSGDTLQGILSIGDTVPLTLRRTAVVAP